LDLPLATPGLHALLAHTQAALDARLASLDGRDALTLRGRLADGVLTVEEAEASTRGGRVTWLPGRVGVGGGWLGTRGRLRGRAGSCAAARSSRTSGRWARWSRRCCRTCRRAMTRPPGAARCAAGSTCRARCAIRTSRRT